jgi:arylsulfatase A-like enzyme
MDADRIAQSDGFNQAQLEMLQAVDRAILSMINAVNSTGRSNNTIFIFTSDNGLTWGEHRLIATKSRNDDSLVMNIDLAPTIADWTKVAIPSPINGISFAGLITNSQTSFRTEGLIEHWISDPVVPAPQYAGVRTNRYVYVEYVNGEREFYDLLVDPYQLDNKFHDPAYSSTIVVLQEILTSLKNS